MTMSASPMPPGCKLSRRLAFNRLLGLSISGFATYRLYPVTMSTPRQTAIISDHRQQAATAVIDAKLLELANDNLASMLLVNVAVGLGMTYLMLQAGHIWIWDWLGVLLAVCTLRVVSWYGFNHYLKYRLSDPRMRLACRCIFGLGALVTGALWMGLTWFAAGQNDATLRYALLIAVSAMAGGATGSLAPMKMEGRAYILLLLVPTSIKMIVLQTSESLFGILGLMFAGVMVMTHAKNHLVLRESMRLRLQNDALVEDLIQHNHAIETLNATLEHRVVERTEALKNIAYTDPLTGLCNRRGLMDWMQSRLVPEAIPVAVLFLDLDRFKQINDAMGHDVGDQVLTLLAARLSERLPGDTILARWGGDEFVVVATNGFAEPAALGELIRSLQAAICHPFDVQGKPLVLGVSIGTSRSPQDGTLAQELILAADLAAAEVKRTGRGQVIAYRSQFSDLQRHNFDLSRELGNAIDGNEFKLAFQPIVDARSGETAAFEVLLRWQHPRLGAIAPDVFIPLAESSDRICEIGNWVLMRACEAAVNWPPKADGHRPKVAVNVSVRQLSSPSFAARLALTLEATHLPATSLDIEVTESLFDEAGIDQVLCNVQALRTLGVDVHIDDFGTGYSSLSRLHQFPVTAIKIDKSFVDQLDKQGVIIVESTVMIARRLGFKVVAEGVETLDQARMLSAMGVDYLQGYYLARPQFEPRHMLRPPVWTQADRKTA